MFRLHYRPYCKDENENSFGMLFASNITLKINLKFNRSDTCCISPNERRSYLSI